MENGLFFDVQGGSTKNGARILLYKKHGGDNQKFSVVPQVDDNTFCLKPRHISTYNKVLEIFSKEEMAQVVQFDLGIMGAKDHQRFYLDPLDAPREESSSNTSTKRMLKLLVEFGEEKEVLEVTVGDLTDLAQVRSHGFKLKLLQSVKERLKIDKENEIRMEYHNKQFNDFVKVNSLDELEGSTKVRVHLQSGNVKHTKVLLLAAENTLTLF